MWVQGSGTGPWTSGSLVKMPPKRSMFFNKRKRSSQLGNTLWGIRRREFRRRTQLMHAVRHLSKMPYHLQKFFLNFMYGKHRAELARLLAARRLQSRLRKRGNGSR